MDTTNTLSRPARLQSELFRQVKTRIPAHLSLADELASLLGLSQDSAYRRIRGEKLMDLGELVEVAEHFKISIDGLLGRGGTDFMFHGGFVGTGDLRLREWLTGMNEQLGTIAGMKDPLFIFRAEDIPTFHFFSHPELTQFKLFFWQRTILNDPEVQAKRLDLDERVDELHALARKVHLSYKRVPCTEIWNADCLNAFLRQITFYHDAGIFVDGSQADRIFTSLHQLIDHLQAQVEAGVKFLPGDEPATGGAAFKVYVNEVMQGDNMIYAEGNGRCMVYVNHSAINYLHTFDPFFCAKTRESMGNVMRRSVLISGTGEKERNRFFKVLREEVERRRMML